MKIYLTFTFMNKKIINYQTKRILINKKKMNNINSHKI